ncbi:MAG: DUF2163 domain-containing protein [Hydrogenophaga sp.]|nr:DUF2163 domain-containing protein [Hydrogenophaga sp.]
MNTLPADLITHIGNGGSTCLLLKVIPVQPGYAPFGVTTLDATVVYDDGDEITYHASMGADISAWQRRSSMDIDNAETTGLMPTFDVNSVTEEDLRAGAYDRALWAAYLHPWDNPAVPTGLLRTGEFGQLRIVDGEKWTTELLGLTNKLSQNVVRQATRTCGATFGSQPFGTGGGVVEERFPCGVDTSSLWAAGEITALTDDPRYAFDTDLADAVGTYTPGAIKFTSGRNAGRTYEVERHIMGGVIILAFPLAFAPQIGDEFEIRPDCTHWMNGANGCKQHWGSEWVLHYRGFPHIPTGEQGRLNSPGASG